MIFKFVASSLIGEYSQADTRTREMVLLCISHFLKDFYTGCYAFQSFFWHGCAWSYNYRNVCNKKYFKWKSIFKVDGIAESWREIIASKYFISVFYRICLSDSYRVVFFNIYCLGLFLFYDMVLISFFLYCLSYYFVVQMFYKNVLHSCFISVLLFLYVLFYFY